MQLGMKLNCYSSIIYFFLFQLIRPEHIIIQSYEEQIDDHRLYVALFIKDPYRQTIALTNEQLIFALQRNQQQIYEDIKHHVNESFN